MSLVWDLYKFVCAFIIVPYLSFDTHKHFVGSNTSLSLVTRDVTLYFFHPGVVKHVPQPIISDISISKANSNLVIPNVTIKAVEQEEKLFKINCVVTASTSPDISMFFKPCEDSSCNFKKVQVTLKEEYGLFIAEGSVESDGSGQIMCKAGNSLGEIVIIKNVIDLRNRFKGSVTSNNRPYEVNCEIGSDIRMECQAPPTEADVKWLYNGRFIAKNKRVSTERINEPYVCRLILTIKSLTVVDSGNYTCRRNSHIRFIQDKNVMLQVLAPSRPIIDNMEKDIVEINYPERIEFSCYIAKGFPPPKIKWFKKDEEIAPSETIEFTNNNQNLSLLVTSPEDEGIYKCEVSNKVGSVMKEFHLRIENNPARWHPWLYSVIAILCVIMVITFILIIFKVRQERELKRHLRMAALFKTDHQGNLYFHS